MHLFQFTLLSKLVVFHSYIIMEKFILVVLVGGILGIGPPLPPSYFMAPVENGVNQVYHAIGKLLILRFC